MQSDLPPLDCHTDKGRESFDLRPLSGFYNLSADYFPEIDEETVRRARPLARRRASTLRPSGVDMRSRKPCLFTLLRFEG